MSVIRQIHIKHFRTIREMIWSPKPGLNCLIGAGDSGKSTILDAIDVALGARRSFPFTDADFYRLDTTQPIEILITLGNLDDQLINIDRYGFFLRGFDIDTKIISDEPQLGQETVLTIKLTVNEDLEPEWQLYSERAESEEIERHLYWKHRELIASVRLGATTTQHLAWGNRSVLNKLADKSLDISSTLAKIGRQTRQIFAEQQINELDAVLAQVKEIGNKLGVPVGTPKALLDVKGVSLNNGAISLHDFNNTPLRQLGTGSSRLLISGLQKAASTSNVIIVDEAEYGLEPHRITRLLNELGSKDHQPLQQVFITTHSPYVLRELQAEQLHILRSSLPLPPPEINQYSHVIYSLQNSNEHQSTLRVCAEAFFSRAVIVAEGKTEIGFVRGIDLYCQDQQKASIQTHGIYCTDGGGDSMFLRAKIFAELGYPTAIFKDSDKSQEHEASTREAQARGISVFEWGNSYATEDVLFASCPKISISELLNIAVNRKGRDSINDNILACSQSLFNLDSCYNTFIEDMRPVLANAAKKKSWYKDIEPAEIIARSVIGPNYGDFSQELTSQVNKLFRWAYTHGGIQ